MHGVNYGLITESIWTKYGLNTDPIRRYHEGILDHTHTHPLLSCLGDAKDSAST